MARIPLPDSLKEIAERDGKTLEEIAEHIGLSPRELRDQYDTSGLKSAEPADASEQTA